MNAEPDLVEHDHHRGPPLLLLAIVSTALFFAAIIAIAVMSHGGRIPSPYEPASVTASFFSDYASAIRVGAFLQLGAAIVFGLFTATVVSRLRFLGIQAAGAWIALFGGFTGAMFWALSALVLWVLGQPDFAFSAGDLHALHLFMFAVGGVGHVAGAGLLVAGVSVSAGLARLVPRWLMVFGLVIAVVAELSTLTLVAPVATYLLPIARLLTFVWLICAAALLPKTRGERFEGRASARALTHAHQG